MGRGQGLCIPHQEHGAAGKRTTSRAPFQVGVSGVKAVGCHQGLCLVGGARPSGPGRQFGVRPLLSLHCGQKKCLPAAQDVRAARPLLTDTCRAHSAKEEERRAGQREASRNWH